MIEQTDEKSVLNRYLADPNEMYAPPQEPSPAKQNTSPEDYSTQQTQNRIYKRALDVYEEMLETDSPKIRLAAARDVLKAFHTDTSAARNNGTGNIFNQINVTESTLQNLLSRARNETQSLISVEVEAPDEEDIRNATE